MCRLTSGPARPTQPPATNCNGRRAEPEHQGLARVPGASAEAGRSALEMLPWPIHACIMAHSSPAGLAALRLTCSTLAHAIDGAGVRFVGQQRLDEARAVRAARWPAALGAVAEQRARPFGPAIEAYVRAALAAPTSPFVSEASPAATRQPIVHTRDFWALARLEPRALTRLQRWRMQRAVRPSEPGCLTALEALARDDLRRAGIDGDQVGAMLLAWAQAEHAHKQVHAQLLVQRLFDGPQPRPETALRWFVQQLGGLPAAHAASAVGACARLRHDFAGRPAPRTPGNILLREEFVAPIMVGDGPAGPFAALLLEARMRGQAHAQLLQLQLVHLREAADGDDDDTSFFQLLVEPIWSLGASPHAGRCAARDWESLFWSVGVLVACGDPARASAAARVALARERPNWTPYGPRVRASYRPRPFRRMASEGLVGRLMRGEAVDRLPLSASLAPPPLAHQALKHGVRLEGAAAVLPWHIRLASSGGLARLRDAHVRQ